MQSSTRDTLCSSGWSGTSPTSRQSQTTLCSPDLKFLCHLIGLHSRATLTPGETITFSINAKESVCLVELVDIGCNIRCLVFEETFDQWAKRCLSHLLSLGTDPELLRVLRETAVNSEACHTIFAFNWFSPKCLRDYVSLGLQLCGNAQLDKRKLIGRVYLEKAEDFLWSTELLKYLELASSKHNRGLITATGFSLGGAIAHAFVYLLREIRQIETPMRIVGMGAPRIGSFQFSRWFHNNVTPDSQNIILCDDDIESGSGQIAIDYDPVCQSPALADEFAFHPNSFLLHRRFGTLRPLTEAEMKFISQLDSEKSRSSIFTQLLQAIPALGHKDRERRWKKLHGLIKYYEAMYGLGDDELNQIL